MISCFNEKTFNGLSCLLKKFVKQIEKLEETVRRECEERFELLNALNIAQTQLSKENVSLCFKNILLNVLLFLSSKINSYQDFSF